MRRILLVLTVALVMAAMLLAMAVPAFAVANPNANLRGEGASTYAPLNREEFGQYQREQATEDPRDFASLVSSEAQQR